MKSVGSNLTVAPSEFKSSGEFYLGDSGTAFRMLTALLCSIGGRYTVRVGSQLAGRPNDELVRLASAMGIRAKLVRRAIRLDGSHAHKPLRLVFRGIKSSQFVSAALLVAPLYPGCRVDFPPSLRSFSYVKLTLDVMRRFGVGSCCCRGSIQVRRGRYRGSRFVVPSDAGAMAVFTAASFFLGRPVSFKIVYGDVRPAEYGVVGTLRRMGFRMLKGRGGLVTCMPPAVLNGFDVDASDIPDTSLTLMMLAPFCRRKMTFRGLGNLKFKESDRIDAVCRQLSRIGIRTRSDSSSVTIWPLSFLRPVVADTYSDHRLCMNFSLLGLIDEGIEVSEKDSVAKSYPAFFSQLREISHSAALKSSPRWA